MSIEDEIYFETHEDSLREMYEDFINEECLSETEYSFFDFIREF